MNLNQTESFSLDCGGMTVLCRVRRSLRARSLRLVAHPDGTAELVLPQKRSVDSARDFLSAQRGWLHRTLLELQRKERFRRATESPVAHARFPASFDFACLGLNCRVEYSWLNVAWTAARLDSDSAVVFVSGRVLDSAAVASALTELFKRVAAVELRPRLDRLSRETGISFRSMSVRLQKRRWGSCSGRGSISLNALLLFFPPDLADYVMIHELCHLREMNHSAAFWAEVARYCPDAAACRRRIVQLSRNLPLMTWNDN